MASEVGNSNLFSQVKRHRLLVCCCTFQQCNSPSLLPSTYYWRFHWTLHYPNLNIRIDMEISLCPRFFAMLWSAAVLSSVSVCVWNIVYTFTVKREEKEKVLALPLLLPLLLLLQRLAACQLLNIFVWLPLSISGYSCVLVAWIEFILLFYSFLWCHFVSEWTILSLYDMWIRIQSQGYNL